MFNIMTMDLQRTSGDVRILNENLDQLDIVKYGNQMGMCPQFNTIWEKMTVDQCLSYVAEIKGVPSSEIEFQKEFIKNTLDLGSYSLTKAG